MHRMPLPKAARPVACRTFVIARAAAFRPCIDIHKGRVKQIVGGTLKDSGATSEAAENFVSNKPSSYYAKMYREDRLTGGHIIMLGQDTDSVAAARGALSAWPGGMQLGGGVNIDNAAQWLDAGAAKLVVTSFVFHDGRLQQGRLDALVSLVGRDRLVLDLSCRKRDGRYYVVTDRWQNFTDVEVNAATLSGLAEHCSEFLVHGVDVEGRQLGVDQDLLRILGSAKTRPTTYAGGVTTMDDLRLVEDAGQGAIDVTVGSALDIFGGALAYNDVVTWHMQRSGATSA